MEVGAKLTVDFARSILLYLAYCALPPFEDGFHFLLKRLRQPTTKYM